MKQMTSRERVLTALRHQEPDRVPLDLGGMRSTGMHAVAYNRLKKYLGIETGATQVYDVWQQLALTEEALMRRFGIDVIPLNHLKVAFGLSNASWKAYTLPDGSQGLISSEYEPRVTPDGAKELLDASGVPLARMPADGFWFDQVYNPLCDAVSMADIAAYDWGAHVFTKEDLDYLTRESRRLHRDTEYAVVAHFGGSIFEWSQLMRGYANAMADLAGNTRLAAYLLDRMTEVHMENLRLFLDAVGDHIDVIVMGDDLGMQSGPWISPRTYRDLLKPRHSKMYQYVKERCPHIFVFLHSCGSIYSLLPDLIDAGVDIINPVQVSAKDMDPVRLKQEFGDRLTFWGGGVDTQTVLPKGTPTEVRKQVKERMAIFGPGGGFIFCQVHNVQSEVPPENVLAMLEAAAEFRDYPLA